MNTKLLPCCISLCACLAVASVSAAPFVSSRGYSITPASGWRVNTKHDPVDDVVFEYKQIPAVEGVPNFRVDVLPLSGALTLEELKPVAISSYERKFPGLVAKSQTFSSLGGLRDLDLVFTQTKNGVPFRLRQIYVLRNGLGYAFTVAYSAKTPAKYDRAVAQMLASVRWKG